MEDKELFEEVKEIVSSSFLVKPNPRRRTRKIRVGNVYVGGDAPVSVQTMTKNPTEDTQALIKEVKEIEEAGADIVRISVPDEKSAISLLKVRDKVSIPIVADIHFDPKMAIKVLEDESADCVRINPGNIKSAIRSTEITKGYDLLEKIIELAKQKGKSIRVGVNAGSLEKPILERYGKPTPQALCESALLNVKLLERLGFNEIKVSLKSSDPYDTILAYFLFSSVSDYPLHVGVTEAGTRLSGAVRSSVALGILLWHGVGDTIRVSLAAPAVEEVIVGKRILESIGIRPEEGRVVACPTCARTQIDVVKIAEEVEREIVKKKIKKSVAIMGCVVNGPGESYMADFGVVGGGSSAVFYADGKPQFKTSKSTEEIIKKVVDMLNNTDNSKK